MSEYRIKYLKYKNKYIQLKKNFGGASSAPTEAVAPAVSEEVVSAVSEEVAPATAEKEIPTVKNIIISTDPNIIPPSLVAKPTSGIQYSEAAIIRINNQIRIKEAELKTLMNDEEKRKLRDAIVRLKQMLTET